MTIDEITEMWEQDSQIDRNKIAEESIRSALLHQKYLSILMSTKNKLIKYEHDQNNMKMIKYRYYRGELTREELEEYGWAQYQGLKPLKADMSFIMESDKDLSTIQTRIKYLQNIIYQLEQIMIQIKARDWQIKSFIDYTKFISGA